MAGVAGYENTRRARFDLSFATRKERRIVSSPIQLAKKVTFPYQLPQSPDLRANRAAHALMPPAFFMKVFSRVRRCL
jgi:hypothetical protein